MNQNRYLIAHRSGRQEERGFFSQQICSFSTEMIDAGILTVLFISYFRFAHRTEHSCRRSGLCVAVEVDVDYVIHGNLCFGKISVSHSDLK